MIYLVIEVASGEYDPDMTKLAKAAMRRYEKTTMHRIKDVTGSKNSGKFINPCGAIIILL